LKWFKECALTPTRRSRKVIAGMIPFLLVTKVSFNFYGTQKKNHFEVERKCNGCGWNFTI